jgi:hypothetical protein
MKEILGDAKRLLTLLGRVNFGILAPETEP